MVSAFPAQSESGPVSVFIHIPKTAGTTMRTVIRTSEPGERNRRPGANVFRGGGGSNPKTLEKLRDEPQKLNLDFVRVLHGHQPFGISGYLERAFPQREFRYFTFVRDPVERSLSHYFEVVRRPRRVVDGGPVVRMAPLPPDTTFDGAVELGYLHDNVHTRMLSGTADPFGTVTAELLEQAKRNLRDRFALVGLTERLDESLVLAKQRLGFRNILVRSRRVNTRRPRGRDVPEELRAAAERHNQYDIELYHFARELFEDTPELNELEFLVELAALRTAKADDDPDGQSPAPPQFQGGEKEWRMLLDARVRILHLERERTLRRGWAAAADAAEESDTDPLDEGSGHEAPASMPQQPRRRKPRVGRASISKAAKATRGGNGD